MYLSCAIGCNLSFYDYLPLYRGEKGCRHLFGYVGFAITDGTEGTQSTESNETEDEEAVSGSTECEEEHQTISIDFEQLRAKYPDVIGWLYCKGTPINYPVMQSYDNNYYLRRLPDEIYNIAGSFFADYRCAEIGEQITILFTVTI